jgi:hypothetical protein
VVSAAVCRESGHRYSGCGSMEQLAKREPNRDSCSDLSACCPGIGGRHRWHCLVLMREGELSLTMMPNISLNPDASPAALARRPLGAG